MSPFRLTRRDAVLVITVLTAFILFLQLDVSLRFRDSASRGSLDALKFWSRPQSDSDRQLALELESPSQTSNNPRVHWEDNDIRTDVLYHAPGWTVLKNVFLQNGTWFIVTDTPDDFPEVRKMISSGENVSNDPKEQEEREGKAHHMSVLSPADAAKRFGPSAALVQGVTLVDTESPQFIAHYYHFAAELIFGYWRTYSWLDKTINAMGETKLPMPVRFMFPNIPDTKWNDRWKMNSFVIRALFPGISISCDSSFRDRADTGRTFVFDSIVLSDRSTSRRFGQVTIEDLKAGWNKHWWVPARRRVLEFLGMGEGGNIDVDLSEYGFGMLDEQRSDLTSEPKQYKLAAGRSLPKGVITYISRQNWNRRKLRNEDDAKLVEELRALEKKHGWEVNVVFMDQLGRDEQLRLAARTTIMMGVHGNGLTHLLWVNTQDPRATVMEFFYPGGFAGDYQFHATCIGIKHYGFWNNVTFTEPDLPPRRYPDGFQGNEIPIDGKVVAQLVEQRMLIDISA